MLMGLGAVDIMAALLRRLAHFVPADGDAASAASAATQPTQPTQASLVPHLLAQLTAALRNLAGDANRGDFARAGIPEALRPLLARHGGNLDVALNAARVLRSAVHMHNN